jgi:hypothetical protein
MQTPTSFSSRRWIKPSAPHNNGMHPTADTTVVIFLCGAARRVMPGVRRLIVEHEDKGMQAESGERETDAPGVRGVD